MSMLSESGLKAQRTKKGKTSPRRARRDISSRFMSIDDQVELQHKQDYEEFGDGVDGHRPHDPSIKSGMTESDKRRLRMFSYMRSKENPQPQRIRRVVPSARRALGHRQRSEGIRSSAASGDSNGDSDPDSDPERCQTSFYLYDQQALADLLGISKKTLQNKYSSTPHSLPVAISIPGARGPRWTYQSIQEWLTNQSRHTQKPETIAIKRKAGRPRIALAVAVQGGAA